MIRGFVAARADARSSIDRCRLTAALGPDGEAHLLEAGPWALAYTGARLPPFAPGRPVCLLDGTIYEAVGRDLPGRSGAELELRLSELYASEERAALLTSLRGDFVLVFLEPGSGNGLVVRDQMGGRSAVWHALGGLVVVASEHRPLIDALPTRPAPDPVAVAHWIGVSGFPGDRSLYTGVHRIEAGCALHVEGGGAAPRRYWTPSWSGAATDEAGGHAPALRSALERSIERRLDPGERAAVLLSGGLDSGTVAALGVRAGTGRRLEGAYSATFPGHPSVDESSLIADLATQLGLSSTTIHVEGGSVIAGAIDYLRRHWVPPMSPNLFFWTPLLRGAAADGVEVMLDGEGGDELFGLSGYLIADRLRRGRLLSAVGLVNRMPYFDGERASWKALGFYLRRYGLKGAVPYRLHDAGRRLHRPERYAPDWMREQAAVDLARSDDKHAWKRLPGPRWFAHLVDRVTRGMGPALGYDHVRRRSALAGIEPRHPLVDVDVVELVLSFPPELSYDPARSRPVLRESMSGALPDAVRLRSTKSNFDAIFHDALTGLDLAAVHALLERPDAAVGAYVELGAIRELIARPPAAGRARMQWALTVWRLVTAEAFLLAQAGDDEVERRVRGVLAEPRVSLSRPRPLGVRLPRG